MTRPTPIKLAIAGVGNCASSLVQGVHYYRQADPAETVPGLMHVTLGGYHVSNIEFVAAFDVDAEKVGLDLGKGVFAGQNNTLRFCDVPTLGVTIERGPTLDGLGKYYRQIVEESPAESVDVAEALRRSGAEVLVSYLPVGSEQAQKHYAQACLDAGVAFVNAIPVFIASDPAWAAKFEAAGVPIIGDDIKSQVGSTIVHRVLTRLFEDRGLVLDRTLQLNVGGNMDFKNMLERERLESKKISKTQAVTSQIDHTMNADSVHIGPSDHVPWLEDRKWAYIRMEGRNFGDAPLNVELKLEVWDSPNSAGVIIDAVRCARLALDRGLGGPLLGPSAYFMKSRARWSRSSPRRPRHPADAGGDLSRDLGGLGLLVFPPLLQAGARLVLTDQPVTESDLEQELKGTPDSRAGGYSEQAHHLDTVELRPHRIEGFALGEVNESRLQFVHPIGEIARLGLAASRAIAAGELVQAAEEVPRVVAVAADRTI
jgi:myo-inositol-1-phosphate synthase